MTTQPAYTRGVGPSPILEYNCTYNTNYEIQLQIHKGCSPFRYSPYTAGKFARFESMLNRCSSSWTR